MTRTAPRIGIRVPQYGGTWDDIRGVAQLLERAGIDALWVNDHFQSPGRVKTDPTFDALTTLAAVAAITTRVREAGVGGIADPAGRMRVVAWVVADGAVPDGFAADLRRHVAHHLAPYMAPQEVLARDALPRLPSGKLDRKALRESAA